jgi:two-component system chemotaxis response regulator CheB
MSEAVRRVRVLVADASASQRAMLSRLLGQDPVIEVVGWAASGAGTLRAVARLKPDIVTLDAHMPGMDGLETARHIMRDTPTPIVMLSSSSGEDARAFEDAALAVGVLAVQDKRALVAGHSTAAAELMRSIKGMASVRLVRRRRDLVAGVEVRDRRTTGSPNTPEIVAIGASTGGPQVLREIISGLPASYPLPVLVVQHTTSGTASNLVDWLQFGSRLPVHVAQDGAPLGGSGVYLAPSDRHLVVQARHMTLLDAPPVSLHRPSATVLFQSVAAAFGGRSIGILLTGMGDDGAAGLIEMKQAGSVTIAQDERTSVVFGMPGEAIRLGAADHVLVPGEIVALLIELAAARRSAA